VGFGGTRMAIGQRHAAGSNADHDGGDRTFGGGDPEKITGWGYARSTWFRGGLSAGRRVESVAPVTMPGSSSA